MILGTPAKLQSQFRLTYNMILNLMKVEGISPEFMLERCFYQFQNNAQVPIIEAGECRGPRYEERGIMKEKP